MVTRRGGHSLPELIVAVSFLGATIAAVGGSAVLGAHWTAEAVLKQRAVRAAAATLDSLARAPEPQPGSREGMAITAAWVVDGDVIRVTVYGPGDRLLARLEGRRVPAVPVLPDVGVDSTAARP